MPLRPRRSPGMPGSALDTGIAGISIEDSSGDPSDPLFGFSLAVERIVATRRAIDDSGTGVLLCARSEGFMVGRPDITETVRRLTAYAAAGADCVSAPGLHTGDTGQRHRRRGGAPRP